MSGSIEMGSFILGILRAVWLKASMNFSSQEKSRQLKFLADEENPAAAGFIKGLSLILVAFGMETPARLFLD